MKRSNKNSGTRGIFGRGRLCLCAVAIVGVATGCVVAPGDGASPDAGPSEEADVEVEGDPEQPDGQADAVVPAPVETASPFASLVSQTFRWADVEYVIDNATLMKETGEDSWGPYEKHWLELRVFVTNRVNRENSSALDWDLVLADGSRVGASDPPAVGMLPLESGHFTIVFNLEGSDKSGGGRSSTL